MLRPSLGRWLRPGAAPIGLRLVGSGAFPILKHPISELPPKEMKRNNYMEQLANQKKHELEDQAFRKNIYHPSDDGYGLLKEWHLARQLSQIDVPSPEQLRFEKMCKKFPAWKLAAPHTKVPPSYEMDGLNKIHENSYQANTLLEIRHSMCPASSHHPSFTRLAKHRKHLIVYTHADVLDLNAIQRIEKWTQKSWPKADYVFIDSRPERSTFEAFQPTYDWLVANIEKAGGYNCALTVGVPNVGKSSVLLALMRGFGKNIKMRKGKRNTIKAKPSIANKPGHTRELNEYVLRDVPRLYCLDVPGITPPHFFFDERPEAFFALRCAGCINEHTTDDRDIFALVKFALHAMNRDSNFSYVKKVGLEEPTWDVKVALNPLMSTSKQHTPQKAAEIFIKFLRSGNFGPVVLDDIATTYKPFQFDKHGPAIRPNDYRRRDAGNRGDYSIVSDDEEDEDDWSKPLV